MSNKTDVGGKVPRLRFPEFHDAPEWKEARLGKICEVLQGYGFPERHQGQADGDYPFYKVSDISNCVQKGECFIKDAANYINEEILKELKAKTIPVGSTIFARIGEAIRSNRRVMTTTACVIDNNVAGLKRINGQSLDLFIYYLFSDVQLEDYAGGVVPAVNKSAIENIPISYPTILEQKKIADCLSSLDNLITAQTKKLDALKAHKKGLMQQLFPAEGETVPKLRFPEFLDTGTWEERMGGTLFRNRIEEGEAGLPIYSVTMNDGMTKRASLDRRIDDISNPEGNKKAQKNDIAYNVMRMWQGASGVVNEDCMVSPAYVVLAPQKGVDSKFFGYLLKLPRILQLLTSHSQGLTKDRLRLYYKDFSRIPLLLPSLPEQQKIATFLSSIDDLITTQTQKIESLKAHKKGLMQQLFPSADEASS